jgi:diacylglycerol O-acyltransferase / wax synthase
MTAATGRPVRPGQPVIERASPTDRAFLAMDTGEVPEQFGVILLLDPAGGFDLADARRLIAERVPAVPRLRQRLARAPFGGGGPIWVDDPRFDIASHVRAAACPEPRDEQALLDYALSVVMTPLQRAAPLWSATFVTGLADGTVALVVVLHHALADGVGGLTVLAHLIDAPAVAPHAPRPGFPRPAPSAAMLTHDAWAGRLRALRHATQSWRLLRASMGAGGGLRPPRAAPCSLNQRTGPRRRLAVVRADLSAVRAAAHRHGATANDAVLVAVAGALRRVLLSRGEPVGTIVITVPVSGRPAGSGPDLGNMVSPMLVTVPATGAVPDRLAQVAAQVRAHKTAATGPPPIAVLGWLFRPLAALGGYQWYMNHQHRFHTLISHVRGPTEPVMFGGSPITSAIPVGVGPGGNVPVYFEVLSYAGTLAITAIIDPGHFAGLGSLTTALRAELDLIVRHPGPAGARPAGQAAVPPGH